VRPLSAALLADWLRHFADAVAAAEPELTELDRLIGDADHGTNLNRGFSAVAAIDPGDCASARDYGKRAGMALVSSVGGASGPLYGTFLLRLAAALPPDGDITAAQWSAALRAGLDGLVARGKAERGDKTMVDALAPALARDIAYSAEFAHRTLSLTLPRYKITASDVEEYSKIAAAAETDLEKLEASGADKLSHDYSVAFRRASWYGRVEKNFKRQESRPDFTTESHVIRLGDVAFATNRFEMYLDYAMRIKCRSKAVQTFVVQLCGEGTYLPTARAMAGGSYGAIAPSIKAGPEGGRILVEETLRVLNSLFDNGQ